MWLREMRDGAWSREKLGLTGEKPLSLVNRSSVMVLMATWRTIGETI